MMINRSTKDDKMPLLQVKDLHVRFQGLRGIEHAVRGISFDLNAGETLALVGESGSGKSVTALALTRLLPQPPACHLSGAIRYRRCDILTATPQALQRIRGKQIAYVFQEPSAALNPVFSVGDQIAEAVKWHFPEAQNVTERVIDALRRVEIRQPERRYKNYPHQLSGGMNQRVMIAMALACQPSILVADEPTTALDVTIQAEIMRLLQKLQHQLGMSILLITHNFGLVKGFADRVVVMFRGRIVETGSAQGVLEAPQHPYTRALIACVPRLRQRRRRLTTIDYRTIKK